MGTERITRRALVAALIGLSTQPAAARGRGGGSRGGRGRSGARGNALAVLGYLMFAGALAWFLYLVISSERQRRRLDSDPPPSPPTRHRPRADTKAIRKAIARHERRAKRRIE